MRRIKKTFRISLVLILALASLSLLFPLGASAQIPGIARPFGGLILAIIPCPCSFNAMLIISPPRGGTFMIDFGVKLYANYSPVPGRWTLGLADGYIPCLQYIVIGCVPIGGGPRIRMLGTS